MALTPQDVTILSGQMLTAALNGDHAFLNAFVQRVDGDPDGLQAVASSMEGQLAENGVSEFSPVGKMVGALSSDPAMRVRFLTDHGAVLAEYGLVTDQMQAVELDDQDHEAARGSYTNP